ncbi:MAG: translation initiation factor IF-2 [Deltaproteobacteria bacterium]|jgi:translation initiation factor IF-2|nr:translation initiation factor IF-2 [Deltaproteobacteria bacterium]
MAKLRVYELARDLNMTNKVLIAKLNDLDIEVKSHMSALEEEVITKVKSSLFGGKEETVEETRVKPTVIRRRRKKVTVEAVESPEETANDIDAAVAQNEQVTEEVDQKAVAEEAAEEAAEAAAAGEPAVEETPPAQEAPKPAKVRKKEPSAKIIKLPVKPPEKPLKEKKAASQKAKVEVLPARRAVVEPPPPAEDLAPSAKKKRKRKKQLEESEVDKKFLKKKISFRRKAVVEGEDLYGAGYRPRKQRKLGKGKKPIGGQKTQITVAKAIKRRIKIDDAIVLSELAKRMGIKASEIIKFMMGMGSMATVNQTVDFDTASLIANEFEYEVERASFEEEALIKQETDDPAKLQPRPPVVTIMGHVDHGKTSLLDVIRKSRVSEMEAGGITQHIGAYLVNTDKGQIAFLDTPGHEAFTAMRARGAQVTDIVVLVVAADDGVMPQTTEAINHARAADVPIIVAINKIDKQNADPDKVQRELAEIGLTPEEWGGDTIYVKVSAKEAEGIDELLEMISLQAEVLELKANPDKLATGHVVEAKIDSGRGPIATVLVKDGTLKASEPVVCGMHYGRIRAMLDDRGNQIESAGPSIPVEIVGLSGVPMAGDEFFALKDERNAKQVSEHRQQKQRSKELAQSSRMSLDKLYERMQAGEVKDLNLIIKADVHGSIEALYDSLTKLSNDEVNVNVVHSASGTIAESDISLAAVSNAIIIGFNVRPTPKIQALANEENVDMRFYSVIYDVIKDVKSAMAGMMASTFEEHILGTAEVREVFQIPKIGNIAGCYVTDGKIERGQNLRLLRDGVVVFEGKNSSLRRFKDDVKEVQAGYECGIGIEHFNDIKVGDTIDCYYFKEIRPELE